MDVKLPCRINAGFTLSSWICQKSLLLSSTLELKEPILYYWEFAVINISAVPFLLIIEEICILKSLIFIILCNDLYKYKFKNI